MHSKKGAEYMGAKTADLILALLALVVIGTVIVGIFFEQDFFDDSVCKLSVYFSDQSSGLFPVLCHTKDSVIENDKKQKIMWEIADSMRSCWSQWGEGDWNPKGKNLWYNEDFQCFKCERLKFPNAETDLVNKITVKDMKDFFEDPDNKVKGYGGTYVNYFDKNIVFGFRDNEDYFDNMIKPGDEYAVTFVENIEENNWVVYGSRAGAGAVTGASIGGGLCFFGILTSWATPACAAIGGAGGAIVGIGYTIIEDGTEAYRAWRDDRKESDAIMFSKYKDVQRICGGFIE
jgi:hypothetical protein